MANKMWKEGLKKRTLLNWRQFIGRRGKVTEERNDGGGDEKEKEWEKNKKQNTVEGKRKFRILREK